MAGIISPSMPVWVVENTAAGNRAYCNLNEGLGKVLRFGANRRRCWTGCAGWVASSSRPCRSPCADWPTRTKPLMAQALHMGDELHNRNAAARRCYSSGSRCAAGLRVAAEAVRKALAFVAGNDHFFLNISMAACR